MSDSLNYMVSCSRTFCFKSTVATLATTSEEENVHWPLAAPSSVAWKQKNEFCCRCLPRIDDGTKEEATARANKRNFFFGPVSSSFNSVAVAVVVVVAVSENSGQSTRDRRPSNKSCISRIWESQSQAARGQRIIKSLGTFGWKISHNWTKSCGGPFLTI